MLKKFKCLTGIRPTGDLHIGNLIGMMNDFKGGYLMIADLHALTDNNCSHKNSLLKARELFTILKISGLIGKTSIFKQSENRDHLEIF